MYLIKLIIEFIAEPLANIFNCSFSSGVFPECFKSSVISPIHKKGSTPDVSNYRPISLLNYLSKILVNIVNYRFNIYLEENKLLVDQQFGFRAGRSTSEMISTVHYHGKITLLGFFAILAGPLNVLTPSFSWRNYGCNMVYQGRR